MALVKAIASKAGVKVQDFVVKNDSRCGSTVGPMLSSRLGKRGKEGVLRFVLTVYLSVSKG